MEKWMNELSGRMDEQKKKKKNGWKISKSVLCVVKLDSKKILRLKCFLVAKLLRLHW